MKSSISLFIATLASLVSGIDGLKVRDTKCGCGTPLPNGIKPDESVNLTLDSNSGVSPRKYRLHLPQGYDNSKKLPLILSFHGRTQDALYQEELSQFSNASYGFEGISVYPQGVPLINKKGKEIPQWQGDPEAPSDINDVEFTLELIDHLEATFCVDSSRIYAAGKSNGGGFTGLLACDPVASTRIAAFAPVSGAFYLDNTTHQLPACNPGRLPVPLMEFHSLKDSTINYTGGSNTRGDAYSTDIITYVDQWAQRDGFAIDANKTSTLCNGPKGFKLVTKYSWGDDTVAHYAYKNLEHDWPSSFPNRDTTDKLTCKEAEATSIILAWFKTWTLEGRDTKQNSRVVQEVDVGEQRLLDDVLHLL